MMVPGAKANDIDAAGREIMMKNSFGLSMAALLGRHGEGWSLYAQDSTNARHESLAYLFTSIFLSICMSVGLSVFLVFLLGQDLHGLVGVLDEQ